MVLNEMLPNEQLANVSTPLLFKVEPANQFNNNQYYTNKPQMSFCADLTINGNTYKEGICCFSSLRLTTAEKSIELPKETLTDTRIQTTMYDQWYHIDEPFSTTVLLATWVIRGKIFFRFTSK